ncbi:CBF-domain-containing protein [Calocera cornea HHB12733]|uniref:CBF-domain-containing protein n=1 Tax=Calocera cornea HHB12733 TaxID=1353952 RepID=A0A165CA67_9BASI|nr:CBF-domain-containing protein [Calocera cornea HHB12733]
MVTHAELGRRSKPNIVARQGKGRSAGFRHAEQATYGLGKPRPTTDRQATHVAGGKSGVRSLEQLESSSVTAMARKMLGRAMKTTIAATPYWYDIELTPLSRDDGAAHLSADILAARLSRASDLLEKETQAYTSSDTSSTVLGMSASDATFLSRILSSGTLSDRLSALTLMVQSSPLHNTRALDALKSMAGKKSRDESLKALRAIADWWIGGGAPTRKLKYIRDQPLNHPSVTDRHLMVWYFEDWVKKYFFSILQLLESLLLDPLPFVRTQAMTLVSQLLKEKPEQEQNLLRLLVNKLGDPERSVASKASFHLLHLLQSHPAMKAVVIREISSLILRTPSSSSGANGAENQHAKYYGIITFNQTTLTKSDTEVARALVDVYFDLFREMLGKEGEGSMEQLEKASPMPRGKDKGKSRAPVSPDVEDENSKMIAAILTGINRALPFAELDQETLNAHVDLLFRITHSATFNISVQALVLVFHVMAENKTIVDRFHRTLYESLFDPRLLTASKQTMYLNLLFRALKADTSIERQMAFVKRIFQALTLHQPPFICGAAYLMGELLTDKPELRHLLKSNSALIATPEDGDTEKPYDPRKREPLYANASKSGLWEVSPFLQHFHPSVSLHTRQLADNQQITATADLGLNTIMHFLDRFVYRNPKTPKPKGASAMQPTIAGPEKPGTVRLTKGYQGNMGTVNASSFWSQKAESIPVDQLFFHQYFSQKSGRHQAKVEKVSKRKRGETEAGSQALDSGAPENKDDGPRNEEEDMESSEASEDEAEIWKAMKSSLPDFDDKLDESDIDDMDDDMLDISDLSTDDSVEETDEDEEAELLDGGNVDGAAGREVDAVSEDGDGDGDEDFPTFDEELEDLVDLEAELEEPPAIGGKRRASGGHGIGKRRKLGQLPTFATYEDYREMIEAAPEENI